MASLNTMSPVGRDHLSSLLKYQSVSLMAPPVSLVNHVAFIYVLTSAGVCTLLLVSGRGLCGHREQPWLPGLIPHRAPDRPCHLTLSVSDWLVCKLPVSLRDAGLLHAWVPTQSPYSLTLTHGTLFLFLFSDGVCV